MLLGRGADRALQDDRKKTALDIAVAMGHKDTAALLSGEM